MGTFCGAARLPGRSVRASLNATRGSMPPWDEDDYHIPPVSHRQHLQRELTRAAKDGGLSVRVSLGVLYER